MNILCFGEILWDAFGDEKKAGGAPMNVARHLVQQNMNVLFASRIGNDSSGSGLIDFTKESGLYSELIQVDDKLPTCEVTVQLDANGVATYIIPEPVSWDNVQPETTLIKTAQTASAIIYGSLACREQTTKDTLLNILEDTTALKVFLLQSTWPLIVASALATRSWSVLPHFASAEASMRPLTPTFFGVPERPIVRCRSASDTPRSVAFTAVWEFPLTSNISPCAISNETAW